MLLTPDFRGSEKLNTHSTQKFRALGGRRFGDPGRVRKDMGTAGKEEEKPALGHWEVTGSQVPSERPRAPRKGVLGGRGRAEKEGGRCWGVPKGDRPPSGLHFQPEALPPL